MFLLQFHLGAKHTWIFIDRSGHFDLSFHLGSFLVRRLRSAKVICNNKVFPFNILDFKFIAHNSAEHSLESNRIIFNRFSQYGSKSFVVQ